MVQYCHPHKIACSHPLGVQSLEAYPLEVITMRVLWVSPSSSWMVPS